ncbi:MAG: SCO family protein [Candidatus Kryptoniota bacterium]
MSVKKSRVSINSSIRGAVIPAFHNSGILLFLLFLVCTMAVGCGKKLPVIYNAGAKDYVFLNQDGSRVSFPSTYKNKLVVLSFIYTHCPDICPLTTNNMQLLRDTLADDGMKGVKFVTLTFDPHRDTPFVLKQYAEVRGIKFDDPRKNTWDFLTGTVANTDSVLYTMKIRYFPGDSSCIDGRFSYFISHTDECVLLDGKARVRGVYSGSQLDFAEIIKNIKSLE